jgi:carbamoyl-phosphate synthase large subunit
LVIPTIDTELPVYAENRERFREAGVEVAVSGPETVSIARDKVKTHRFLTRAGLPTVGQYAADSLDAKAIPYPLIVKPRFGSAATAVHVVEDDEALQFYRKRVPQPVVQDMATGKEYTVNVLVDRGGRCVYAVPHWRVETRGGEVSKCVTVRQGRLIEIAEKLCRHLPDAYGPLCFQAFVDQEAVRLIELNARFGGGYPVAHQAGADFISRLVQDAMGRPCSNSTNHWTDGVAMTRWDDAVFADLGTQHPTAA